MPVGGNFPGTAAELAGSARWHVHQVLPTGRAEVVAMTREAYGRSDFLDHRIAVPQGAAVATLDFARITPLFAEAGHLHTSYIFHISHVGSTLLSKALATRPTVLGLREPQLLRWLAEIRRDLHEPESRFDQAGYLALLQTVLGLLGRTFESGDEVVVKATSFASNLAGDILALQPQARAIALYSRFEPFAANVLRGKGGWTDVLTQAPSRMRRLHASLGRTPWRLAGMSHGEVVALNWLCEVTELAAASRRNAGRVCWIEFDDMMGAGAHAIGEAARFLGIPWGTDDNARLRASDVLSRYSKDESRAFGQDQRRALLAQVSARHADEIAKGLAWLYRACRDHPELACAESFIQRISAIA